MAGRTGMQTVRALVDEALVGLRAVADPGLPVRQAEEELARALRAAYAAQAARADAGAWREGVTALVQHLRAGASLLASVPTQDPGGLAELDLLHQAMVAVTRAIEEPLGLEDAGLVPPRTGAREPLRASLREPRLLDLEREVLLPAVPLPELPEPDAPPPPAPKPPPLVTTPEQLDALLAGAQAKLASFEAAAGEDVPPRPAAEEETPPATDDEAIRLHFGTAWEEHEVLLERARTCMEDLSMFGLMRRPRPDNPWWSGERTERRLLRRVDAIAACGDAVLPRLVKMLEGRPLPDPELTWGNLFLFGSFAGEDALDQMLRIIRSVDLGTPEMAEAVADALALAPHPGIERAVHPWLEDGLGAKRAIALRVLARRGALTVSEAVRGAKDAEPGVVRAAARGLSAVQGALPSSLLDSLLRHEDEEVVHAALEGSLLRRSELGLERARELCRAGRGWFAESSVFLALAAGEDGGEVLRVDLAAGVDPTLLRAIGWFGGVEFVDGLLGHLQGKDPEVKAAAVEALQRLTGASLTEARPDPEYRQEERPFLGAFAPPSHVPDLTDRWDIWSAWWATHGRNAKAGTRYRFGHAWSPRDTLWELELQDSLPEDRRRAHVELAVRTGGAIPLDREDFVARQVAQLTAWRAHVEATSRRGRVDGWATRYAR